MVFRTVYKKLPLFLAGGMEVFFPTAEECPRKGEHFHPSFADSPREGVLLKAF